MKVWALWMTLLCDSCLYGVQGAGTYAVQRLATGPYRSVRMDDNSQLSIELTAGGEVKGPKLAGQVEFGSGAVSEDGGTVGWLALYPDPGGSEPLAGGLVLYRKGRVLRSFATDQIFWDWRFADGDRYVAYCTGPTHGGAAACELHNILSGQKVAAWNPIGRQKVPRWAAGLHY